MKIVSCLKLEELKESKTAIFDGVRILLRILGAEDKIIYLRDMPFISNRILYTQIGTCLYLGTTEDNITFLYVIEQEIKNNKLRVKNIYTDTIVEDNHILAKFFRYDESFQRENLSIRLFDIIDDVQVIIDKEYLKEKILDYLEREEEKKEESEDLMQLVEQDEGIKSIPPQPFLKTGKELPVALRGQGRGNELVCYGKKYDSWNSFIREYKLPHSSVWYMLARGERPEDILKKYNIDRNAKPKEDVKRLKPPVNAIQIECDGKKYNSITEFAKEFKMSVSAVGKKLKEGKTPEEIVAEKGGGVKAERKYEYEGEIFTIRELSEIFELPPSTIYQRIKNLGWSVKKAVETPLSSLRANNSPSNI